MTHSVQLPLTLSQRWHRRRDRYRPPHEVITPSEYEVAAIPDDRTARAFIVQHHYSGSMGAARFRHVLVRRGRLVGVAVYSHPVNDRTLTSVFPGDATESVELGRFVLVDEVPGNGETWFLARSFELLRREGLLGVVAFSDPVPRSTADGRRIFPGHIGRIYAAHNSVYLGRGAASVLHLLPDGRVLSRRTIQKIRARERGWEGAVRQLRRYGAPAPGRDLSAWLRQCLQALTRPLRHRGNHKYAWVIDRARRALRRDLDRLHRAYPTQIDLGTAAAGPSATIGGRR
jgi:hypothetical protein